MRSPRCRCSCRCGRRSAPRSPPSGARKARERADVEQSARDYFALAGKTAGAAAAASGRGRRAVGHRQVAARPRAGSRNSARRRARWCCAATSSARPCSALAETERLPQDGLCARGHGQGLRRARRQGAARARRRPFGDRRRGVRRRRASGRRSRRPPARRVPRPVPDRRSRRPACPASAGAKAMPPMPTRGRARAGAIRSRRDAIGRPVDASGSPEDTLRRAKAALGLA